MRRRNVASECYACSCKRELKGDALIQCANPDANMLGEKHGIKHGWFDYPVRFDPVWKVVMCRNWRAETTPPTTQQGETLGLLSSEGNLLREAVASW